MLIKLTQDHNCTLVLKPSFEPDEIGYGGRNQNRYKESGGDMAGFKVELSPFYDTNHDPRFKDNPKLKAEIEKLLQEHPNFNRTFKVWDLDEEIVTVTRKEQKELAAFRKKEAAREANGDEDEVKSLKGNNQALMMRDGKQKKEIEKLKKELEAANAGG